MWTNLTAACAICNNNKRAHDDSNLPLINPVTDEPSDYIQAFGPYLTHKSPGNKGEASITVLELNRAELLERRGEKLNQLTRLIDIANLSVNENTKKLALIDGLTELPNKRYLKENLPHLLSFLKRVPGNEGGGLWI